MQRNFTFSLPTGGVHYRLWEDLIALNARVVSDALADYPFPTQVSGMVIQAFVSTVTICDSKVAAPTNVGTQIVPGANQMFSAPGSNGLDLTQFAVSAIADGSAIAVTIDAL
jgi:hypothetical protein